MDIEDVHVPFHEYLRELQVVEVSHFYTLVFRRDVVLYGDVCPSVFPSIRSFGVFYL
jgi:hypothetical protein